MVVQHCDKEGIRFFGQDYLSFLYWFIPRAIWPSKPIIQRGEWVTTEVFGFNVGSSTGQTVAGDFYMNFGVSGVIIGFFVLGFFQRVFSTALKKINSIRYIPLIPFVIFALAQVQSDVGPHFAGTIRNMIFYAIVLIYMFPRLSKLDKV